MGSMAVNKRTWCEIIVEEVEGHTLRGLIPMLLPPGVYKFPDVSRVESHDGSWIEEWIRESGLEPQGETPEEKTQFARDMATFCAYLIPGLECGSDAMKFYMWIMTLGFLGDDVLEGRDIFGRDREAGMKMATVAGELFTGKYSTLDSIPFDQEAFGLKTMIRAGFVAAQKAQAHIPNFYESATYFAEAVTLSYSASLSLELEDHYDDDDLGDLPIDSYDDFRFYEGGFQGFIELAFLCHDAVPSQSMRQNVIFKRLLVLAWHISIYINDLFGVRREIESGRGYNSVIYRTREMELPEAFEQVVGIVNRDILNFGALATRYKSHHRVDSHEQRVLRVLEEFVDGHIYSFQVNRRYGNIKTQFLEQ